MPARAWIASTDDRDDLTVRQYEILAFIKATLVRDGRAPTRAIRLVVPDGCCAACSQPLPKPSTP